MKHQQKFRGKAGGRDEAFVKAMRHDIQAGIRYLKRPYCKIKCNIKHKECRILAHYDHTKNLCIPLLIVSKKDKVRGENMRYTPDLIKKIGILSSHTAHDISHGNYIIHGTD